MGSSQQCLLGGQETVTLPATREVQHRQKEEKMTVGIIKHSSRSQRGCGVSVLGGFQILADQSSVH